MKCSLCTKDFIPAVNDDNICEECLTALDELSNGKGDDEDV